MKNIFNIYHKYYIILFLIIFFCFINYYYLSKKNINENFSNKYSKYISLENEWMEKKFNLKEKYNPIIPLHVYQTWYTKDLPPKMKEYNDLLKEQNQEFTFHLYDDKECSEFIKKNFSKNVYDTFEKLIPGAFKADLWRYCILYKYGGIYLDIKYYCVNQFKLIALTEKEHFVRDYSDKYTLGPRIGIDEGIYNGLIVVLPNNKILKKCIDKIVENVHNNYYGDNPLKITGPLMMRQFFSLDDIKNMHLNFYRRNKDKHCIRMDLYKILDNYPEYRDEQEEYGNKKHYGILWKERDVYLQNNNSDYEFIDKID